jgi:hypothetical protein
VAEELIYTSAPRGLRLGSSGFCTVACTRGMGANYIELLESMSGYAMLFPPHDPSAPLNPVSWRHYRILIGGKQCTLLSRIAAAGVDYSHRSNKVAHHIILRPDERPRGGPAWVMQRAGVMLDRWEGEPQWIDAPRRVPEGDSVPGPCLTWQNVLGDAGWGGALAQSHIDAPRTPAFLVFEPGMPVLQLLAEALALLPAEKRWGVTFDTYFSEVPAGAQCLWRCCLPDAEALKFARRTPEALVIDLTAGDRQSSSALQRLQGAGPLLEFARTGRAPAATAKGASKSPASAVLKGRADSVPLTLEPPEPPQAAWTDAAQPFQSPAIRTYDQPDSRGSTGLKLLALIAVFLFLGSGAFNALLLRRLRNAKAAGAVTQEAADDELERLKEENEGLQNKLKSLRDELERLKEENETKDTKITRLQNEVKSPKEERQVHGPNHQVPSEPKEANMEAASRANRAPATGATNASRDKSEGWRFVDATGQFERLATTKGVSEVSIENKIIREGMELVDADWIPGGGASFELKLNAILGEPVVEAGFPKIKYLSLHIADGNLALKHGAKAKRKQLEELQKRLRAVYLKRPKDDTGVVVIIGTRELKLEEVDSGNGGATELTGRADIYLSDRVEAQREQISLEPGRSDLRHEWDVHEDWTITVTLSVPGDEAEAGDSEQTLVKEARKWKADLFWKRDDTKVPIAEISGFVPHPKGLELKSGDQ